MFIFLKETLLYVIATLIHNAPYLMLGILIASIIKVYVNPEKMKNLLMSKTKVSIPGSVAFGAFTPFCACGTMAIIISMLTTALPWGPIMAFLTSSPLMSPDKFVMISGIVSVKFAIALTFSSVIIGLGSGYITHLIEKKTNLLKDQARFKDESCTSCNSTLITCCTTEPLESPAQNYLNKDKFKELLHVFYSIGVKQVLLYFSLFAAIGHMINTFVPAQLITQYLGKGNLLAVPLLALFGLPLYVTGASSIPVINALMAGGASGGGLLAFMITGPGTSAGVIAGLATIMKKKAIVLYVTYLLVFSIVLGYLYDLYLMIFN